MSLDGSGVMQLRPAWKSRRVTTLALCALASMFCVPQRADAIVTLLVDTRNDCEFSGTWSVHLGFPEFLNHDWWSDTMTIEQVLNRDDRALFLRVYQFPNPHRVEIWLTANPDSGSASMQINPLGGLEAYSSSNPTLGSITLESTGLHVFGTFSSHSTGCLTELRRAGVRQHAVSNGGGCRSFVRGAPPAAQTRRGT